MGKIIILDENTSNQIAAGEVIERPASIVKEMAENALDAGATSITVEINGGGIKSIRITDNGEGMEADDVAMAFERYGTSKIKRIDDLDKLTTMGFRGEALASMASVSKVEVITKTEEAKTGTKVIVEAGNMILTEPVGAPKGTTFIIRELFYNTPARYKFLKKDSTEAGYIHDILVRIALGRPDISIKLINQGKTVMHTPGNHDLLSVIYSLYGKEIARSVIPVDASGDGIGITGFVGKAEISKGNRSSQSIIVNNRFVYNKIVTAALEGAYKTRLMQKRFPFAVLKLSISPAFVDVNVHPAKLEVRFSDEQKVFRAVYHAVFSALSGESLIPTESIDVKKSVNRSGEQTENSQMRFQNAPTIVGKMSPIADDTNNVGKTSPTADDTNYAGKTSPTTEDTDNVVKTSPTTDDTDNAGKTSLTEDDTNHVVKTEHNNYTIQKPAQMPPASPFGGNKTAIPTDNCSFENKEIRHEESLLTPIPDSKDTKDDDRKKLLNANIIGQAFDSFIIIEDGDELLLIDQHAAHERIRYERIRKQFSEGETFSQGLLSPLTVNLSELEMDKFHDVLYIIEKLGFEAEDFGDRTIIIRSIPYVLDGGFSGRDFLDILNKLRQEIDIVSEIVPEETIYMMACKSAIKANREMTKMEIRGLIEELTATDNPYTCVHGRPIIISMHKREFEKKFKRIL